MAYDEGVCRVCAKVCHKDHDLGYSRYGLFYCDCGAKGDSACQVSYGWQESDNLHVSLMIAPPND